MYNICPARSPAVRCVHSATYIQSLKTRRQQTDGENSVLRKTDGYDASRTQSLHKRKHQRTPNLFQPKHVQKKRGGVEPPPRMNRL